MSVRRNHSLNLSCGLEEKQLSFFVLYVVNGMSLDFVEVLGGGVIVCYILLGLFMSLSNSF